MYGHILGLCLVLSRKICVPVATPVSHERTRVGRQRYEIYLFFPSFTIYDHSGVIITPESKHDCDGEPLCLSSTAAALLHLSALGRPGTHV
ncbi:hypothetical protein OH77DRAFT_311049 [Trametes cingulata]|nr:hypothetical protein OH77DRAFT_311049 [Trametes cingulata]